ncbi:maleylpyruvate isomerase family mycothiol-dependent enzyme [Microbispora sp. NPDC049125]|uniref:maleylpyruvate isomerase family mycothiol-dependent enzyme n=1 Tax=Microbispora sp. NPDC049125 TaxID=3154929 RepID=UPI0034673240
MQVDEYVAVLREDGERLADAALIAGLDADVPTCPGWRIRELLHHTGGVHRWAAAQVGTGRSEPHTKEEEAGFFPDVADDSLVAWFREGHRALVGTLAAADETTSCWTFLPAPSPLAFWARRQAHETAIHRADAESAVAAAPRWDPRFAADGVDELLNGFFGHRGRRITADPAVAIAVSAVDVEAAWTIRLEPGGHRVVPGVHPADLTLTGPARDLYLLVWNRGGPERLAARGDLRALDAWRAGATVRWS